jgi:hypothetical protein
MNSRGVFDNFEVSKRETFIASVTVNVNEARSVSAAVDTRSSRSAQGIDAGSRGRGTRGASQERTDVGGHRHAKTA